MAAYASDKKPIEYLARKGEGKMDHEEFCAIVKDALAQSVQYVDEELSPERAKATDYYNGKPFGNEEEGRSQVVMTEVRDASDGMLPSLLRVFFGAEHSVEFVPTKADNVEQAAQKTDYVRYVFEEDNDGFLQALAVLKDGLTRKLGVFAWGWDESVSRKTYKMEGISKEQLDALAADPEVEFTKGSISKRADGFFDVELIRTAKDGRAWVEAVPPEEFISNRQARNLSRALVVGRRTQKTRGELIAMGISEKDIKAHGDVGDSDVATAGNVERIAREDKGRVGSFGGGGYTSDPEMGKANDKILYCDVLMLVDFDGDGTAEVRRVCTIGSGYYPVKNDPDHDRRFAVFTPYPEPHTLIGGSVADRTMDVQKINSAIMRGILDSGAASIFPRTVYQEGQASVADIMNTAIGAPIRERMQNAVRILETPFTGDKLLPVLTFMQEVIERRTGRNKGAAGLDADALQSTGKEAVGAVLTGSQEQIEMIARVFAQMTLKPLFKGLGRLLHEKQPRARMVRLRGNWVEVDPKSWDADMDVTVNVGLGSTFTEKKVATLMAVAGDQKEIITTMGLANPLVSLPMLRNTRAKILALQGLKDVDNYYLPLPPNWQPPPPPPPQPSPDELWIRAEKEMNHVKTMKELAIKEDELKLEREKFTFEQHMELRKLESEIALKRYEIEAKTGLEREQGALDREVETEVKEAELTMAAHSQMHDQTMQEDRQTHEKQMAERAAETADKQVAKKESAE